MYSKSSECNITVPYDYLCTENYGNQEYGPSPFYATMGKPLIYYCQVPQQKLIPRSGNVRKDNRNCFTKAFQWYTGEHVPHRDEPAKKSGDVKGFANWLDTKYEQFLQENCDSCGIKVKHTSITEAYRFPNEPCEIRRKKFRVKSPWRKKRGHKDTGDVTSKCSFHFIMKPKDMSRPTSDTNEMSNAMMMSSEVAISRYSHSCNSLRINGEPSTAHVKKSQETMQSLNIVKVNKDATKSLSNIYSSEPQNILCQCRKITKRNAYTQSDPSPAKSPSQTVPKLESRPKMVPKQENPPETVPKSERPSQTAQIPTTCPCFRSNFAKISHPTKIEIAFEAKPSPKNSEIGKCQCSKEFIPKADAQCQFQTDVKTCACGSDHSMVQEKSQTMLKKVKLCPCEYDKLDFETCPLQPPPVTNSNQNQPILCNHCIPCKKTSVVTNDGHNSYRSNTKTMGNDDGLNPRTGYDGILASNRKNPTTISSDGVQTSNLPTIANDGVQTSNLPTIANDGVQTSSHSIRIDKDAASYPLFMKIVFADKLCKF